jgi:D-alanyl-D-alanine dipeptidase
MTQETHLIDIAERFPQLYIDMKYATADNITGQPIYSTASCLLHADAVVALEKSIEIARMAGFSLLVMDAYRPQKAQELLWHACPSRTMWSPFLRAPTTAEAQPLMSP